jgi:hypothetical protein
MPYVNKVTYDAILKDVASMQREIQDYKQLLQEKDAVIKRRNVTPDEDLKNIITLQKEILDMKDERIKQLEQMLNDSLTKMMEIAKM